MPYRIFAFVLWFLAISFEVLAILFFTHTIEFSLTVENPGWMISWIVCLVLDLICVIVGSQLWKKSNHLDPAPKNNKVRFWLHNNLGLVVSVIAFAPFIIFVLTDKKANKQSKIIAAAVAVVALLIAGLTSYDWNPMSQEELLSYGEVYYTPSGTVFHTDKDCQYIRGKEDIGPHSGEEAEEAGKARLCKACEARDVSNEGNDEDKTNVTDPVEDTSGLKISDGASTEPETMADTQ